MSPDDRIVEAQIWNRTTKVFDSRLAAFHGFGSDFEEYESGPAPYAVAIVELADGTVAMPRADKIRFLVPSIKP